MTNITDYEKSVLEGQEGRLKQVCMENILRYAEILGADELCEITKATVFCGTHNYLRVVQADETGEDFHEVFSRMNLAVEETIPFDEVYPNCYIQSCISPCDGNSYEPFGQTEQFFEKNSDYLDRAREAGVTITGTCSPYLTGWLPIRGEHFVTTESGVTVIGNSIWGAMGNSDGIEAAFWSAICGRTPKWGNHIPENRGGTHLVTVEAGIPDLIEWDLLGKAVGNKLPTRSIPVIQGDFTGVTFEKLRQFCTTLAISSNCEMCHIVGYTPEAGTVEDAFRGRKPGDSFAVKDTALRESYESVCEAGGGSIDFVSLGCPHYDIDQIKRAADYLQGKRIDPAVHFMIWTVYPIKSMADRNGYTRIVEEAGGHIYTGSCPGSIGDVFLKDYSGFVFDSSKKAGSVRSMVNRPVYFGDMKRCIDAAVSGRWEEEYRWDRLR
jgi:predicted aconitase